MIPPPPSTLVVATSLPLDNGGGCSDAASAAAAAVALLGLHSRHHFGGCIESLGGPPQQQQQQQQQKSTPPLDDDGTTDPNNINDPERKTQIPLCRTFLPSTAVVQDQSSMECHRDDDDDGADRRAADGGEGRRMDVDDMEDDIPELELDAETLRDLEAFFRTHADFRKRVERDMEVELRNQH